MAIFTSPNSSVSLQTSFTIVPPLDFECSTNEETGNHGNELRLQLLTGEAFRTNRITQQGLDAIHLEGDVLHAIPVLGDVLIHDLLVSGKRRNERQYNSILFDHVRHVLSVAGLQARIGQRTEAEVNTEVQRILLRIAHPEREVMKVGALSHRFPHTAHHTGHALGGVARVHPDLRIAIHTRFNGNFSGHRGSFAGKGFQHEELRKR